MAKGTVKWFNYTKGYGFVSQENNDNDVFVHVSEVEKANISDLKEGQKIQFDVTESRGRKSATNISMI